MGTVRVPRHREHQRPVRAATSYFYGYPGSNNRIEPNVAVQWKFDEASGDIVDEVAGVTLADTGTMDYQRVGTGNYSGHSGIEFSANLEYFDKNSASAEMHLGTGDFTFEWVAKYDSATAQATNVIYAVEGTATGYVLMLQGNLTPDQSYFYFKATDGTTTAVQSTFAGYAAIADDTIHKHRLVASGRGTAGAALTYYIDGVSQFSVAITGQNGKTIENNRALFGWNQTSAYRCDGTMYEFRLSLNSTNNSGGPGGG